MAQGKARRWPWITAVVVAGLVGLYTLAGFWGLPYLIKSKVPALLQAELGQPARLGEVRFNPFTLRLEAHDLVLGREDPRPMASVKLLVVDMEAESLWRLALVCREVTLEEPFLKVVLREDGSLNLTDLGSRQDASPLPAQEEQEPFPFLVRSVRLVKGNLWFLKKRHERPARLEVIPINLTLSELASLPELCEVPEQCGPFRLAAASAKGEKLDWQGRLSLSPLASSGRIELTNWRARTLWELSPEVGGLSQPQGLISLKADYKLSLGPKGLSLSLDPVRLSVRKLGLALGVSPESSRLDLADLDADGKLFLTPSSGGGLLRLGGWQAALRGLDLGRGPDQNLLKLEQVQAAGGRLDLAAQRVSLDSLTIKGGKALAVLDDQGGFNWSHLVATSPDEPAKPDKPQTAPAAQTAAAAKEAEQPWSFNLGRSDLSGLILAFRDLGQKPATALELRQVSLKTHGLAWPLADPWPFELKAQLDQGGSLSAQGRLISLAPDLEADYHLEGLGLAALAPYLAQVAKVRLTEGSFSSKGHLSLGVPAQDQELAVKGDALLRGLSVHEAQGDAELVGLEEFATPDFHFTLTPPGLSMEQATLKGPRFKMVIDRRGKLNLLQVIKGDESQKASEEDAPAPTAGSKPGFALRLSRLTISGGRLDFSDQSLKPGFSSVVRELGGSANDVGNLAAAPMPLRLQGRVDRYGQARIIGRLLPLDPTAKTRLRMRFDNLDLHHLSPYAAKFAGWRIKDGKLFLNLDYSLEEQRLVGDNQVVIKGLVLGEKIEQPDAPNLPLDLAVALLKDSSGRIDVAIPVHGDLSDPQVSIGGLVMEAIFNLVGRLVTAPFHLLAALVGASADELAQVSFTPGGRKISPPQEENLAKLAKAMGERPQLKLEISGGYDPDLDGRALKRWALRAQLSRMSGQAGPADSQTRVSLGDPKIGRALQELFLQHFSRPEMDELKRRVAAQATQGGQSDPDGSKTAAGLNRAMFLRMADSQPLEPQALTDLAQGRAQAVRDYLVQRLKLETGRLSLGPPVRTSAGKNREVPSPLGLTVQSGG